MGVVLFLYDDRQPHYFLVWPQKRDTCSWLKVWTFDDEIFYRALIKETKNNLVQSLIVSSTLPIFQYTATSRAETPLLEDMIDVETSELI